MILKIFYELIHILRWYKIASTGFTIVGIFLLAKHALQHVLEKRRRWELQKRVLAAAAAQQARKSEGTNQESEKEPDNAKKENLALDICVICLEQEYNAVFVP
ncbi:E3 ubiquitin-protein ligase SP1-like [Curcuma longa]|uniref:E3 ubiquitin-protein ligase SP1-like n=1 Tax=Curcuma longa TaxID=136217 RepID=UPI003D9EE0BC